MVTALFILVALQPAGSPAGNEACRSLGLVATTSRSEYSISADGQVDFTYYLENRGSSLFYVTWPTDLLMGYRDMRFVDVAVEEKLSGARVEYQRFYKGLPVPPDNWTKEELLRGYLLLCPSCLFGQKSNFDLRQSELKPGDYKFYLIYQSPSSEFRKDLGPEIRGFPRVTDCKVRSNPVVLKIRD